MLHRISAGAIVEHESRMLFVRHHRPDYYDFWVCPGGGVQGDESLTEAAVREVREECGLDVRVSKLLYVEELVGPESRHVKFWFAGHVLGGELSTAHPVFPPVLADQYWRDRDLGFPTVTYLPLRRMEVG